MQKNYAKTSLINRSDKNFELFASIYASVKDDLHIRMYKSATQEKFNEAAKFGS